MNLIERNLSAAEDLHQPDRRPDVCGDPGREDLSFVQNRLWFQHRMAQGSPFYNIPAAFRLYGHLDAKCLQAAFQELIDNHETLRTCFILEEGVPKRLPLRGPRFSLPMIDLSSEGPGQEQLHDQMAKEANLAFDLTDAPLLRAKLFRQSAQEHVLQITGHHMAMDGWSAGILMKNLFNAYSRFVLGQKTPQTPPEPSYGTFIDEQTQKFSEQAPEAPSQLEFWRGQLADMPARLLLPYDHPHPLQSTFAGKTAVFTIPPALTNRLNEISRSCGSSLFMTLLAGFKLLLANLTGQDDIVVGTAVSNRRKRGFEHAVGCFANTLLLRTHVDRTAEFTTCLSAVRDTVTGALDNQDLPFERLLTDLAPGMNTHRHQIPQVMFVFEPGVLQRVDLPELTASVMDIFCDTAKFELGLYIAETENGLKGLLEYSTDLFDADGIADIIAHYIALLEDIAATPGIRCDALGKAPWTESRPLQPFSCVPASQPIHAMVLEQARKHPNAVAIREGDAELTYEDLVQRAWSVAANLQDRGVKQGDLIGLSAPRSTNAVVTMLGIWLAGAVYVPLDPTMPPGRRAKITSAERLALMLDEDAITSLCHPEAGSLSSTISHRNIEAEGLAYVIHTSGSTGQPKGVAVTHANLSNLAWGLKDRIHDRFPGRLNIGLNGPLHFDTSIKQLVQLGFGHCLVLLPAAQQGFDAAEVLRHVEKQGIDLFDCTPSQAELLLNAGLADLSHDALKALLVGGEAISTPLWARLGTLKHTQCFNLYGPTECTVDASVAEVSGDLPHIGTPLPGTDIVILDDGLRPVRNGAAGEICIRGNGVALGYLGQAGPTAERYVCDPLSTDPGRRLYRSGDLGRIRHDGTIEWLGRKDDQLKLHGLRIEPGEIEQILRAHPLIDDAMVWVPEQPVGHPQLVAAVVAKPPHAPQIGGRMRRVMPNGLAMMELNGNETAFLYDEVFVRNAYFRNGIAVSAGDCVIDVGANIGLFSLAVGAMAADLDIHCLEPNPHLQTILTDNLSLYAPDARLWPVAAGQRQETSSFTFYPNLSLLSGLHSDPRQDRDLLRSYLDQHHARPEPQDTREDQWGALLDHEMASQEFPVDVIPLSQLIDEAGLQTIDLLKINVEKSEEAVLAGLRADHWPRIKQIVLELHDFDDRLARVTGLLKDKGFEVIVENDWSVGHEQKIFYLYARREDAAPSLAGVAPRDLQYTSPLTAEAVIRQCCEFLPAYMVPMRVAFVDRLPLTSRGKRNRRAPLPDILQQQDRSHSHVPCESDLERKIADLWLSVLPDQKQIGRHDGFFDLGGNSIALLTVHARLQTFLNRPIPLTDMFEYRTPAALAQYLGNARTGDGEKPLERLSRKATENLRDDGAIAIIGMAGRFPEAGDVETFWQNLCSGKDCIRQLSRDDLRLSGVADDTIDLPGYVATGGVVDGVSKFDAAFFGMSPADAAILDPQHRIFMQLAWHALEDAGCIDSNVGVFASSGVSTYLLNNIWRSPELVESIGAHRLLIANDKDHLATQTSYRLGLRGPSVVVQTACSSSLVCVHMARQSLLSGECDAAIAGGVSIRTPQRTGYRYKPGGIGSRSGRCAPFDNEADGTVGGNGGAVVVLKRLADAITNGDRIVAIIKGSAINNDGDLKVGYTAPSIEGQADVIRSALSDAGVHPHSITYVEAHGTATPIGDPIEMEALKRVLRPNMDAETAAGSGCEIGSVKGSIGHLDTAAGIVGLIKASLMLQHRTMVASGNFRDINQAIDLGRSGFSISTATHPWPQSATPRRAGVSSFGIGGTNAHVVLEEAPALEKQNRSNSTGPYLLIWSAKTAVAADILADRLADSFAAAPMSAERLVDMAASLATGRRGFDHRRYLLVTDPQAAVAGLRNRTYEAHDLSQAKTSRLVFAIDDTDARPEIGHHPYRNEPAYRQALLDFTATAERLAGIDLNTPKDVDHDQKLSPVASRLKSVANQYALARAWMDWGVRPTAIIASGSARHIVPCLMEGTPLEDAIQRLKQEYESATDAGHLRRSMIAPNPRDISQAIVLTMAGDRAAPGHLPVSLMSLSALPSNSSDVEAQRHILATAAMLWAHGIAIDWRVFMRRSGDRQHVSLPSYPFAEDHHWIGEDEKPDRADATGHRRMPEEQAGDTIETSLLEIWKTALGVEAITLDDDFFDLGGHSLIAVDIVDSIRSRWPVALPLQSLFEATTIRSLAGLIRTAQVEQERRVS
ncbi:amino acid adenylation domain-containing protein/FkbM family methyltransferase [Neorhizobium huautlense]|uniref:Amino acid adenylation domain-containing protein/FkbM family methyltransferase n=1 Tax=Neorhizobium huautlense TaxID=67774 RepID=A0ABT9PV84_9HYPH|nr:non-ribosomal peptide synthetase [Neorhizobium huautlense]MDP9838381.1 amino acid adenylation domain-containing protein/FkbM family methyltransferase [Neorhizobium huautlense]